ncbi:efflux RND transporter periplasmic adaptor subunit [Marinobacterium sediminicola]|uniref:HlyD family secretion protein n=1 Tax=Marinobacterium sediminicola TaxID=518898 RepID=A0ABY1S1A9_9GAMM|nr:HlyD family efflux transporter periplasmic adaptor subunit [Marinobacterium sediminicola]ULG69800.1 biotin/lipoyl-binding protein [Marinobacterium sediminicola]SMR75386.1 HlyD family secretion protein [Marinobacterium sediminicola]
MRDTSRLLSLPSRWLPLAILLAAALITFVLIKTREQPQAQEAGVKRWNVNSIELTPISARPELKLYGQFEAPQLTRLSSALNADVQRIEVREGDRVQQHSLLLELDAREVELQLRQRQSELAAVEARIAAEHNRHRNDLRSLKLEQEVQALNEERVSRAERLHQRTLLSQEQLDNTRLTTRQQALAIRARQQAIADHPNRLAQLHAERDRAQALVDSAQLDLSRTRIQAPFNARIVSIDTAIGNRTRTGDRLLTLYDLDRLQLRAQVPEHLLPILRQGLDSQAGEAEKLSAHAMMQGTSVRLSLARLAARVNAGQAGVDALFTLMDTNVQAVPGQTLSLTLKLPEQSGLYALPPSALYGSNRIYRIVDDDRLQGIEVHLVGQHHPGGQPEQLLVSSAELKPGDRVITTQLPNAIGGLPVKVVE